MLNQIRTILITPLRIAFIASIYVKDAYTIYKMNAMARSVNREARIMMQEVHLTNQAVNEFYKQISLAKKNK